MCVWEEVWGVEKVKNREKEKSNERGRRAIFTVFPSKSSGANCNVYVG